MLTECKKGKWTKGTTVDDKKDERPKAPFSERQFYDGLKWLREHHIVSDRITVDTLLLSQALDAASIDWDEPGTLSVNTEKCLAIAQNRPVAANLTADHDQDYLLPGIAPEGY